LRPIRRSQFAPGFEYLEFLYAFKKGGEIKEKDGLIMSHANGYAI